QVAQIKVERFDATKKRLDELGTALQNIEIALVQKLEREKGLEQEVERSARAAELVKASRAGYETYLATDSRLKELELERGARDERRSAVGLAEQQRARLESDLNYHRESLAQIE